METIQWIALGWCAFQLLYKWACDDGHEGVMKPWVPEPEIECLPTLLEETWEYEVLVARHPPEALAWIRRQYEGDCIHERMNVTLVEWSPPLEKSGLNPARE